MPLTTREIELLRPLYNGVWTPGSGIRRPIYLGVRDLQIDDVLYRGCTAHSECEAREMLKGPRFFSITRSGTSSYRKPKPGDAPGRKGFLLFLTVKVQICLANVSLWPIVRQAAPQSTPHEWQRMNATDIARHLTGQMLHGIWDMDGEEVLIEQPMAVLELRRVREMNI